MTTHVVINRDVISLKEVITVYLHLLSSDTRTVLNCRSCVVTISQLECLNLIKSLAFCSNCCIKYFLCELYKVFTCSHKVGLTLNSYHGSKAWNALNEDTTI